jgi:DNA-binding CsgD family transcriptional regulator
LIYLYHRNAKVNTKGSKISDWIAAVTGRQIAAARALAGISQKELADAANISIPTLKRMEGSDGNVTGYRNNVEAVRSALERAGIQFIPENGGGFGVRLAKPKSK